MAYQVIWSDAATGDVSEIAEYIAKHSEIYAAAMVEKFAAAAEKSFLISQNGRA
jgi:plasmid stabilization system protein ParE